MQNSGSFLRLAFSILIYMLLVSLKTLIFIVLWLVIVSGTACWVISLKQKESKAAPKLWGENSKETQKSVCSWRHLYRTLACHWMLSGYSFLVLAEVERSWKAQVRHIKSSHLSVIKCPFSLFQTIAHLLELGIPFHGLWFCSFRGKDRSPCVACDCCLVHGNWQGKTFILFLFYYTEACLTVQKGDTYFKLLYQV